MPRRPRLCPADFPQHVVQRGNDRQPCFLSVSDFKAYAHWLREAAEKYSVQVHAWVFMRNHVHLLLTPTEDMAVARMMQHLGRCYVRYFNHRHARTGTLWEGRYYSSLIEQETYLLACQRYIEMNPVRAGIVDDPADYSWSSYACNGLGIRSRMLTPHPVYLKLGRRKLDRLKSYRDLFATEIDPGLLLHIRYSLRKGLVLGTEEFIGFMEERTGRRVRPCRRGRPFS